MKILITGATGYIGSNLLQYMQSKNHTIFCTLLPNENNPFGEHEVKSIVINDREFEKTIDFLLKNNIEGIIHLASYVQSGEHKSYDIQFLLDSNIIFGTTLLEAASHAKVNWFINTGTYWQNYNNEDYSPVNLYAATKQAFIDIAKYYWGTDKIKFVTLKLFDTFGPKDPRPKLFNLWEKIARSGEELNMSQGEQTLDLSYIDDVVSAFSLLAELLNSHSPSINNGDVYDIKSQELYTLKELAAIYQEVSGYKLNIKWGGLPYKNKEIMIPWNRGKTLPLWKPSISIKDAIEKIIDK